jgi:hypothetical protein
MAIRFFMTSFPIRIGSNNFGNITPPSFRNKKVATRTNPNKTLTAYLGYSRMTASKIAKSRGKFPFSKTASPKISQGSFYAN